MKTRINAPKEIAKMSKLPVDTLDGGSPWEDIIDSLRETMCGGITQFGVRIGCEDTQQSPVIENACNGINAILEGVGCDPIVPPPPPECITDDDCEEDEECIDNICVPIPPECEDDPDDCRTPLKECENWEGCNSETGECDVSEGRCNDDEDCEGWESYGDRCKVSNHECVDCLSDPDCEDEFDPGGVCKLTSNTCIQCDDWTDCGSGYECNSETCLECGDVGEYCEDEEDCCSYLVCNDLFNSCELP